MVRDEIFSLLLWARLNPNPKLQKEVETKMVRGDEDLEFKDTKANDEMNDEGQGGMSVRRFQTHCRLE